MNTNILLVISVLMVAGVLILINFDSMYNYYVYTAPIKNAVYMYPDFLGDVHYEKVPKGIHKYYASISNIAPQDDGSIDVDFAKNDYQRSNGYSPIPDFSHTQNIKINQTFVVICHDFSDPLTREIFKNSTVSDYPEVDVLKYLGPVQISGEIKHKFYHAQRMLQTDMPCNYPEVIEHSIDAIDLVVPEQYGTKYDKKANMNFQDPEPEKIDSGLIKPEKDIPIFFEVMLMEQGIEWTMPQREWLNPDVEMKPTARVCSQIILANGTSTYLSTILQDKYTLSDVVFHDVLPTDCVKVLLVTEFGK
jgi:hypothetical protein